MLFFKRINAFQNKTIVEADPFISSEGCVCFFPSVVIVTYLLSVDVVDNEDEEDEEDEEDGEDVEVDN